MNDQAKEKRTSQRIDMHIPVRYRKLSDPAAKTRIGAITRNISEGGIRFRSMEFIAKACQLIMELDIPSVKPVKAISKVAWISKVPFGDGYEIGNEFLEISSGDRRLVSDYLGQMTEVQA